MKQISNYLVLNEASEYGSSFSRGVRIPLGNFDLISISGTASINNKGVSIAKGDFKAQVWRVFHNIKELLASESASWQDVYKTTVYIRDIENYYPIFNETRTQFFRYENISVFPSSTCVETKLCRPELLIEMDAMAIIRKD